MTCTLLNTDILAWFKRASLTEHRAIFNASVFCAVGNWFIDRLFLQLTIPFCLRWQLAVWRLSLPTGRTLHLARASIAYSCEIHLCRRQFQARSVCARRILPGDHRV